MNTSLVCLPFAGAGAAFYGSWQNLAPDGLVVRALQLPGREWRIAEDPLTDVHRAADILVPDVLATALDGEPVVLFGHSLGAVLAFEIARRLAPIPRVRLVHVVVSGSPAPWSPREHRATGLPDDEFLRRVEEFAGYTHSALADQDMRDLLLPILRADVDMHESYRAPAGTSVSIPMTAMRGRADALVTAAEAAEWASATTDRFDLVEVDGGHMYLVDSPRQVFDTVRTVLAHV